MVPADRETKGKDGGGQYRECKLPITRLALLLVKNGADLTGLGFIWDHNNRVREVSRKFPNLLKAMFLKCGPGSWWSAGLVSYRVNINVKLLLLL